MDSYTQVAKLGWPYGDLMPFAPPPSFPNSEKKLLKGNDGVIQTPLSLFMLADLFNKAPFCKLQNQYVMF